jgi:26S proteasome regulatory subunit T6
VTTSRMPSLIPTPPTASTSNSVPANAKAGVSTYFTNKIEAAQLAINAKTQNLRRLEAQRNALNARGKSTVLVTIVSNPPLIQKNTVRLLREELQLLQEPGSYVGEVIKVMGKKKVLVKVQPEGRYGTFSSSSDESMMNHSIVSVMP